MVGHKLIYPSSLVKTITNHRFVSPGYNLIIKHTLNELPISWHFQANIGDSGSQTYISKQVLEIPKLFLEDSVEDASSPSYQIYSITECHRDMSSDSCNACLAFGLSGIFDTWCTEQGITGAKFLSSNCQLRFETYEFFNVSAPTPTQMGRESLPPSSDIFFT